MAVTYALMDPVMTIARPLAAMFSAITAGIFQNLLEKPEDTQMKDIDSACRVDGCCDGTDCPPEVHKNHHSLPERLFAGLKYAVTDVWADLAGWFMLGLLLAGIITILVPESFFAEHLGGGLESMLIMLAVGIPIYICASASTPVAAAMVVKGVSPGAALVFLLAGPATNMASLSVVTGILGKRGVAVYLFSLAVCALVCGLILDMFYAGFGISAAAMAGRHAELVPAWVRYTGAVIVLLLSVPPLWGKIRKFFTKDTPEHPSADSCCSSSDGHNECEKQEEKTQKPEPGG